MTFVDHYLRAVRMYLPGGAQTDDIITELSEHLQSRIEEQEAAVGRSLTEVEQSDLLTTYGNPLVVAERYGATRRTVAFGVQLIGPELFPLYARVLAVNWLLTLVLSPVVRYVFHLRRVTPGGLLWPLGTQLVLVTLIFACIDRFQGRSREKGSDNWRFPPAYLQPIPRWQSLAGLVLFTVTGVWWALAPRVPALMFGRAADRLGLAPSWWILYWPVLTLLTMSAAQRAATLVHPEWNRLQPATRLVTNLGCLALLTPSSTPGFACSTRSS